MENNNTNPEIQTQGEQGQLDLNNLTKEQLDEIIKDNTNPLSKVFASWKDSHVTKAIQTAKGKWEAEQEELKDEAKRLAKLSPEQREMEKLKLELQKLQAEKAEQAKAALLMQTEKELMTDGMPVEFAKYIIADDAETVLSNKDELKKVWETALNNRLQVELEKRTKKTMVPGTGVAVSFKKEDIHKMKPSELLAIYKQNPELLK